MEILPHAKLFFNNKLKGGGAFLRYPKGIAVSCTILMNKQLSKESNSELNEESIEILDLDDDSLDAAAVRKSFRIPLSEQNRFLIVISGTSFPLEDINANGAGVLMVEDQSFFKGQQLSDCELILGNYQFNGVECQIVHITSAKRAFPLFGVKWLNIDLKTVRAGEKQIGEICEELKKNLLDESSQDLEKQ